MRVVFDSNVLIAAHATQGLCHVVFEICIRQHVLIVSADILDEVTGKLARKLKVPSKTVKEINAYLKQSSEIVVPTAINPNICRDPKDAHVLGLALASRAECIVSGDLDLLVLKRFENIPILSPRDFHTTLQKNVNR